MQALSRLTERLALVVLLFAGIGMAMSVLLGVADIVTTLKAPWLKWIQEDAAIIGDVTGRVYGAKELTESTMVLIVFGALCYAQIRRSHIRVELVYLKMPPRGQAAMDVLTDVAAIVFFSLLLWQAINEAQYSMQIGEATSGLIRFPLWPARWVLCAGTALMIFRLALDLIVDIDRVRTGAPLPTADPTAHVPELSGDTKG